MVSNLLHRIFGGILKYLVSVSNKECQALIVSQMDFYRAIPVGMALLQSLNELLDSKRVTPEEALSILKSYDEIILQELRSLSEEVLTSSKRGKRVSGVAEGRLEAYQILYEAWRIDASGIRLKVGKRNIQLGATRLLFA